MKVLQFKNKNAQRVYDDYINRSKKFIKILSEKDREDCLLEINSHIYEFLENNKGNDEIENILNIIERLGQPEDTLKEVVASKKTSQAIQTFNPRFLVQALFLNIKNGFIYILLSLLLLFLMCFPILIILKLIYPKNVGFFLSDHTFIFGFTNNVNNSPEILGNWFIPIAILISTTLYFSIIFLLKLKNKK